MGARQIDPSCSQSARDTHCVRKDALPRVLLYQLLTSYDRILQLNEEEVAALGRSSS